MIRLVLADVDGCLTAGEGRPIDLDVLRSVAEINARSRVEPAVPAVSLCTGRPAPYVEVLTQAIAGHMPAIFENGCGLLVLQPYAFRAHPRLDAAVERVFRAGLDRLDRRLVATGVATWQPGKVHSATLYPVGIDAAELRRRAIELLDERFYVDEGVLCINVMPAGIDKGAGVDWLAAETGIPPSEMCGVGDADADLVFLERVGFSAAPSNATERVREHVDYVSPEPNGTGLLDIIERVIARAAVGSALGAGSDS